MDEKARASAALWESQKELVARIDAATSELVVSLSHDIRAAGSSVEIRRIAGRWPYRNLQAAHFVEIDIKDPAGRQLVDDVVCQEPHVHWCCGSDIEPTH